jgi:pSer/pThr/pTyr-binding forkhead associated (FHA) protein
MILITATGQRYDLRVGENIIGRGSECSLRLNSEQVSRRHASIRWDGQRAWITDLGSTNGTRLNGTRLEPRQAHPLSLGDRLELGGPDGQLEVGVNTGVYAEPAVDEFVAPSQPATARLPAWLYVVMAIVGLLLIAAIVLLVTMSRAEDKTAAAKATATPTPSGLAVVATPIAGAIQTVLPSVTAFAAVSKVEAGKSASGAGGGAAQPQAPAMAVSPGQIPPINPTSMPDLVNSLVKEFVPGEVLQPLGTLMPGLAGGTPLPGLPGQGAAPVLPSGPKRYGAPILRAPGDGASFQGENSIIVLEWQPVNSLGAKDYYRVIVFYRKDGRELVGGTWMKATSYRVPVWFLQQQSGRFEWQVVIAEASDLPEKDGKLGATVSDPSARRWFTWNWGSGGPGPDPGRSPLPSPTPTYGG